MKRIGNKRIVNMTGHDVSIYVRHDQGPKRLVTIKPEPEIARLSIGRMEDGTIDIGDGRSIPVSKPISVKADNIPEPQDNTIIIVSRIVAQSVGDRKDVFFPDELVRDNNGKTKGCRSLGRSGIPNFLKWRRGY